MWVLQITFPASIQKPLLVVLFLLPHAESLWALFFFPACRHVRHSYLCCFSQHSTLQSIWWIVKSLTAVLSPPPAPVLQNKVVDVDNLKVKLQVRIRSFSPDASARPLHHVIPRGSCIDLSAFLDDAESIIIRKSHFANHSWPKYAFTLTCLPLFVSPIQS